MKTKEIHSAKASEVKNLAEQIKNTRTLMIVSIKGLPSRQFQSIKKSIRDSASVKVAKKNIMSRAIKVLNKDSILALEEYIKEDCAFVISDIEGYELAGILSEKRTPVFAKAGQIAPDEIKIKEGPTSLVPGPAISELGALGIQIAIEDGKISIKSPKVVLRKGDEIKADVASILQKLNIQPFSVGLVPLVIYDVKEEKIYTNIKIDIEGTKLELRISSSKALGFAQRIRYYCKETIGYLLAKANSEMESLKKFYNSDNAQLNKSEETA